MLRQRPSPQALRTVWAHPCFHLRVPSPELGGRSFFRGQRSSEPARPGFRPGPRSFPLGWPGSAQGHPSFLLAQPSSEQGGESLRGRRPRFPQRRPSLSRRVSRMEQRSPSFERGGRGFLHGETGSRLAESGGGFGSQASGAISPARSISPQDILKSVPCSRLRSVGDRLRKSGFSWETRCLCAAAFGRQSGIRDKETPPNFRREASGRGC